MEDRYKDLIIKFLSKEATSKDEEELKTWMSEDPKNLAQFKEIENIWNLEIKDFEEYEPDTAFEWKKLTNTIEKENQQATSNPIFHPIKKWYSIAAVFLVVIGIGYILLLNNNSEGVIFETNATPNVFYLPDSSVIFLNKNSKIIIGDNFRDQRNVKLVGEAYFDVKKDSLHPFIIEAGNTHTKVLGTSFGIKAYENDKNIEIVVESGKVNFFSDDSDVMLEKNQKGNFNKESNSLTSATNTQSNFFDWKKDRSAFRESQIYKNENASPESYLQNEASWKKNKINQTIIEGNLYNTSIFTVFKNVKIKVTYYDKAKNKIGDRYFTINKSIAPGSFIKYKHSLPDWFEKTQNVETTIESFNNIIEN